jgi:endonuclease G
MKKYIFAAFIFAALAVAASAAPQAPAQPITACRLQAPYGFPQSSRTGVALCHHAYATFVDPVAKIPEWVVYTLTPEHALGCLPRTNAFAADQSLPGSATPADYAGTGYDKGHLGPDADMAFDDQAENESFLMTNMSPQLPGLNRGAWKLLETSVRGWVAELRQPYTIYVGNIYGPGDKTIGSGVVVPHALFKIVINAATGEVAGWVFPQAAGLGNDLTKFRTSVAQIQQLTGVRFGFPPNAKELGAGQEWKVDFGQLTAMKRQKCGANASVE